MKNATSSTRCSDISSSSETWASSCTGTFSDDKAAVSMHFKAETDISGCSVVCVSVPSTSAQAHTEYSRDDDDVVRGTEEKRDYAEMTQTFRKTLLVAESAQTSQSKLGMALAHAAEIKRSKDEESDTRAQNTEEISRLYVFIKKASELWQSDKPLKEDVRVIIRDAGHLGVPLDVVMELFQYSFHDDDPGVSSVDTIPETKFLERADALSIIAEEVQSASSETFDCAEVAAEQTALPASVCYDTTERCRSNKEKVVCSDDSTIEPPQKNLFSGLSPARANSHSEGEPSSSDVESSVLMNEESPQDMHQNNANANPILTFNEDVANENSDLVEKTLEGGGKTENEETQRTTKDVPAACKDVSKVLAESKAVAETLVNDALLESSTQGQILSLSPSPSNNSIGITDTLLGHWKRFFECGQYGSYTDAITFPSGDGSAPPVLSPPLPPLREKEEMHQTSSREHEEEEKEMRKSLDSVLMEMELEMTSSMSS